jgi:uncharacterized protein YnzC (UPF0291/DUF896 family)
MKKIAQDSLPKRNAILFSEGPVATAFFDTHRYIKCLKISGTPANQAEAHATALAEIMNNQIVRKSDLNTFKSEMKADFNAFKIEVKTDMHDLRNDFAEFKMEVKTDIHNLGSDFAELKADVGEFKADVNEFKAQVKGQFDLLKWMTGVSVAASVSILIKLFH